MPLRLIIILTTLFFFNICKSQKTFTPDTSVFGIKLLDTNSIKSFKIDTIRPKRNKDLKVQFYKHIRLINENKKEVLILNFYPGGTVNEVALLNVKYNNDSSNYTTPTYPTNINNFMTESGVKLGMTKEDVIKIKGTDYTADSTNIIYKINNYKESEFLKRYNYPSYFEKLTFNNNILIEFEIGFELP